MHFLQGKYDQANSFLRDLEETLGPDHPALPFTLGSRARVLQAKVNIPLISDVDGSFSDTCDIVCNPQALRRLRCCAKRRGLAVGLQLTAVPGRMLHHRIFRCDGA